VKKRGFKPWERQINVSTGEVNVNAALEPEQAIGFENSYPQVLEASPLYGFVFLVTHSKSGCLISSTSLRTGSLRFSRDGILCGLHPTDFSFRCLQLRWASLPEKQLAIRVFENIAKGKARIG
jgi:hypothetical protein